MKQFSKKYIEMQYKAFVMSYPLNVSKKMDDMSEDEISEWMYEYQKNDPIGSLTVFVNQSIERWIWSRKLTFNEIVYMKRIHEALYLYHMKAKQAGKSYEEYEIELPRFLSFYGCNLYKAYGTWADVYFDKSAFEQAELQVDELPF